MISFPIEWSDFGWMDRIMPPSWRFSQNTTDDKIRAVTKNFSEISAHRNRVKRFSPLKMLLWSSLFVGVRSQINDPFPAQFDLAQLDGTNGFSVYGEQSSILSGWSVSTAGDVNNDGLDDFIIGAISASRGSGRSYVVFGKTQAHIDGILDLNNLDGVNGYRLFGNQGKSSDSSGWAVSTAGDMNGDGYSDVIVATKSVGISYVAYGSNLTVQFGIQLHSDLNGANGFKITGRALRNSVSCAGDMNGDGLSDIILGGHLATQSSIGNSGKGYVVYGVKTEVDKGAFDLTTLNGTNGFFINGESAGDFCGYSVSTAGDFNGDGLSDIVIGAPHASPSGRNMAGKSYVVLGSQCLINGNSLNLAMLNSTNGLHILGEFEGDQSGISVSSAGDVNGDSIADIVIGASEASQGNRTMSGKSYVVFGRRGEFQDETLELSRLDGTNGFIMFGGANDKVGISVSSAGDFTNDGFDDLLIGATGKVFLVFGKKSVVKGGMLDLTKLDGSNGLIFSNMPIDGSLGLSVSKAGDVNGDKISDVVIGAHLAHAAGRVRSGKSYVIFGRNFDKNSQLPTASLDLFTSIDGSHVSNKFPHTIVKSDIIPSNLASNSFRSIPSLRVSLAMTSSTGQLLSPENDQTGMLVGIVVTIILIACSVFSGGAYYYRRLKMKKDLDESSQENNGAKLNSVSPDSQVATPNKNYDLLPTSDRENHYSEWPAEQKPHDASHYISIDKIEKAHDNYVDAKMLKAQEHYSEIRN